VRSIFQYLTEDFQSGYEQFVKEYVVPTQNQRFNPNEDLEEQIGRLKLFGVIFAGTFPDEPIINFYDYYYDHGDDDINYDEFIVTNDLDKFEDLFDSFKEHMVEKVSDVRYEIMDYIKPDGSFEIYRAMTVGDNWIDHLKTQGKRLGIYWSMKPTGADAYWSDEPRTPGFTEELKFTITSKIHENAIDWMSTISLQLNDFIGADESEIRLFKGSPIRITRLQAPFGRDVDISAIKNKTFYA
jgi:hypothetical protein